MKVTQEQACQRVRAALAATGVDWQESNPGVFAVTLPGERRLATTCSLVVGAHTLSVQAFVLRCPEENHQAVYRWLLERNTRMYGVAFALDGHGDVYLTGRTALDAVTEDELDRLLGSVLEHADASFNPLLELGYRTAIRREWAWRVSRGEPLTNLAAFAHVAADDATDPK